MEPGISILKRGWVQAIVAPLASLHVSIIYHTSSLATRNDEIPRRYLERGKPIVACFWHGRLLTAAVFCLALRTGKLPCWPAGRSFRVLVSSRGEGRLFAFGLRLLGIRTVTGATGSRGTAAARATHKALAQGVSVLITPDGPRGPSMQASPGVVRLAGMCGAPVIPIGCASSRRCIRSTWDRLVIPLPFSRMVYVFGEPVEPQRDADDATIEMTRKLLEDRLTEVTIEADRLCGEPAVRPFGSN